MIKQTVWPGNYRTYRTALEQGLVHGVALTTEGALVAEVRSARRMLVLVLADPQTMTVTHRCNAYGDAPCWHLALGLELLAFAKNHRLAVRQKRPVATVYAESRCVKPEEIGVCKDITGTFLEYAGLQPVVGNFSLVKTTAPATCGCPARRGEGLWGFIKARLFPVGGTLR